MNSCADTLNGSPDGQNAFFNVNVTPHKSADFANSQPCVQAQKHAQGSGVHVRFQVLAKLYLLDDKKDLAKAVKWLEKACEHESIKPYAAYTYAKILLDDNEFHDAAKAIELLEDTADENNWCAYLLGKLYLFGNDDVEKDKQKAIEWLTKSAEDGNAYAEALLQHSEDYERSVMTSTVMSLFAHLARIIEDDYMRSHRKLQSKVDRKLRRIIEQKKEDLGIKSDGTIHYDY